MCSDLKKTELWKQVDVIDKQIHLIRIMINVIFDSECIRLCNFGDNQF